MHAHSPDERRDLSGDDPGPGSVLTPDVDPTADAVPIDPGAPMKRFSMAEPEPSEFEAVKLTLKVPCCVGVPEIEPVAGLSV